MAEIQLYDDQLEYVDNIREAFRAGHRSVLGVASTGFGKSITSAYVAKSAAQKGSSVWFTCHRKNLMRQSSLEFWKMRVEHGMIAPNRRHSRLPVQIASIQTLRRRLDKLRPPHLLEVDEAHMAMAASWRYVVEWCKERGSLVLGNSASPHRLDGRPLGDIFDVMVESRPMWWLIQQGRLSDYRIYAPSKPVDTSKLHTRGGEYVTQEAEELMDKSSITGDCVSHYKKYALEKRTVCYCVSKKHSRHVAQRFNDAGIPAVHIDSDSTEKELKEAIWGFATGRYWVLCNVELITTGFDLSAQIGFEIPIEAIILLRPTQSLALFLQMVGRGLRKKPHPAIILDHAGCCFRHGLPDEEREWSLEGDSGQRKKPKDEGEVSIRQCPRCFHVHRPKPVCPSCGHVYELQPRELEERDGELVELDAEAMKRERKQAQGRAKVGRASCRERVLRLV